MRRSRTEAHTFTGHRNGPGTPTGSEGPGLGPIPAGPPFRESDGANGGPADIDRDVAAAVGRTLEVYLQERLDTCRAVDTVFARDIATRVVRFVLDGGKRLRSQFLWWGFRACSGTPDAQTSEAAMRLAAGLELIQTCALIHDDVMDGSSLRRGDTTVHTSFAAEYGSADTGPAESFGTAAAILVGDLALAWADDLVAGTALTAQQQRRVRTVWQAMRTEMVAGQYRDLHGRATGSRSPAAAVRTASLKSAQYSVERPLLLGAALAEADERTTRSLRAAGRCAGLAFQLRDDLLGAFGDSDRTGKPSGDDIRQGKVTLLLTTARSRAASADDRETLDFLDSVDGAAHVSDADLERLRAALVTTGARAAVEEKIDRLTARSFGRLSHAGITPPVDRRLRELFGAVAGGNFAEAAPGSGATAGAGDVALPSPAEARNRCEP